MILDPPEGIDGCVAIRSFLALIGHAEHEVGGAAVVIQVVAGRTRVGVRTGVFLVKKSEKIGLISDDGDPAEAPDGDLAEGRMVGRWQRRWRTGREVDV